MRFARRFLLSAVLLVFLSSSLAQTPDAVRIGVVVPTRTGTTPVRAATYQAAGEAARMGAIMAEEEFGSNAELLGKELKVLVATAPDADSARRAAERLVAAEDVFALIGGFGEEQARVLSEVAEERGVIFFNIGSPSLALRGEGCSPNTFHVEASAAMYLDALAAWFIRSDFRRWFFVYSEENEALYERAKASLKNRHFGAKEVGKTTVAPQQRTFGEVFGAIEKAEPDVVLLLTDPVMQLDFLTQYDSSGLEATVTGFPDPVAQTREFYAASRNAAPQAGTDHRAALWEATLDSYGARELNERFLERWGMPMDGAAWAAYESVKMLFETANFAGTLDAGELVGYLESPTTVFDVHKGIGVSFRPWDHQLRQSLFLVNISEEADTAWNLATLVGQLPAIYMPGTDPVERLDQLGDLKSKCRF